MTKYIILPLLLLAQISIAQNKSITGIIDNLEIKEDSLKSAFDWVAKNIKYDVRKAEKIENGANFFKEGNYKSLEEYKSFLLKSVIKKKQGVCDDYTLLFDALVKELGYESHIVIGMTKFKDGKVNNDIGHSWNIVKVNNEWKFFDPTWGAGFINDKNKFTTKYNSKWYATSPEIMQESHFPFDPIWQISNTPITFEEFKNGKPSASKATMDYNNLITKYLQKNDIERSIDELPRVENYGGNAKPIKRRKLFLQSQIDINKTNHSIPLIISECKASTELFNEYIANGKNKKFEELPWTLEYSEEVLFQIQEQLTQAIASFKEVKTTDPKAKKSLKKLVSQTKDLLKIMKKEIKYLENEK